MGRSLRKKKKKGIQFGIAHQKGEGHKRRVTNQWVARSPRPAKRGDSLGKKMRGASLQAKDGGGGGGEATPCQPSLHWTSCVKNDGVPCKQFGENEVILRSQFEMGRRENS